MATTCAPATLAAATEENCRKGADHCLLKSNHRPSACVRTEQAAGCRVHHLPKDRARIPPANQWLPRLTCIHMRNRMRRGWAGGRRTCAAHTQLARALTCGELWRRHARQSRASGPRCGAPAAWQPSLLASMQARPRALWHGPPSRTALPGRSDRIYILHLGGAALEAARLLLRGSEHPRRAGRLGDGERDGDPGDGPLRVVAAHDQHRLMHAPRQACA